MRSFSPVHLKHLLAHRLMGDASFADICDEHIIVNAPEPYDYPPSYYLPRHLENIVKLHPETFEEAEKGRIYGEKGFHDPIEAFRIRNVRLRYSGLYRRNWRFCLPYEAPPATPRHVDCGSFALSSSYGGCQYFGHWLRDDLTTKMLAEDFAEPFCVRTPQWPHKRAYLDIFDQTWPELDHADFNQIYLFLDSSQNSNKIARIRQLREKIRTKITPKHQGRRVYLRRGETGAIKRIVSNEAQLIKTLEAEGFIILDLTKDSIETIIESLLDARLFITVEGSQAAHSLYTIADGGGYLSIAPPTAFNNPAKDWLTPLGVKYGFVVGERDGEAFKVDIPGLMQLAEQLYAAPAPDSIGMERNDDAKCGKGSLQNTNAGQDANAYPEMEVRYNS